MIDILYEKTKLVLMPTDIAQIHRLPSTNSGERAIIEFVYRKKDSVFHKILTVPKYDGTFRAYLQLCDADANIFNSARNETGRTNLAVSTDWLSGKVKCQRLNKSWAKFVSLNKELF